MSNAAQYRESVRIHPLQKGEMSPHPSVQREQSQKRLSYDFSQKLCGNMNSSELLRLTCSG